VALATLGKAVWPWATARPTVAAALATILAITLAASAIEGTAVAIGFAASLWIQRHFGWRPLDHRLGAGTDGDCLLDWLLLLTIVVPVEIVAILVEIVVHIVAVLLLELLRHLRLRGSDDAIVVFGVLEIVLGHHPVAGAVRIPRQRSVFLRNLLRGAPDFHVRPVAFVVTGQRIGTLAVVIIIIVVAAIIIIVVASAHAPVLLLWPHPTLFGLNMFPRPARISGSRSVWFYWRSPASVASASRAILSLAYILAGQSPHEAVRLSARRQPVDLETELMTALPASSHPVAGT
jgi:hypothetical protein